MKNLKFLFGVACLFVASFSFTSCLDSDGDDYSLSPEQYTQYMKQIPGTYSGKMYFWNDTIKLTDTKKSKEDSLKNVYVYVRGINDSTITVTLPTKYLGKNIKNTDENKALKKALDDAPNQTLTMKYYLYQLQNNVVYFGVYPTEITTVNVNYGGADHKVEFSWYPYYNFNGQYSGRYMTASFLMQSIKVDNQTKWTASNSASDADEYYNPTYTFRLEK